MVRSPLWLSQLFSKKTRGLHSRVNSVKASESEHARALFSALGLRKGVNCFSYKHLLNLTRAGRVTPGKFFSI